MARLAKHNCTYKDGFVEFHKGCRYRQSVDFNSKFLLAMPYASLCNFAHRIGQQREAFHYGIDVIAARQC